MLDISYGLSCSVKLYLQSSIEILSNNGFCKKYSINLCTKQKQMKQIPARSITVISCLWLLLISESFAQDLPTAKPEDLGFSTQRLARLDEMFNSYVTENKMAGSVILVARKGKVGYYKAFGFRDK